MIIYFVRNIHTGEYGRRAPSGFYCWTDKWNKAHVWTNKIGPGQFVSQHRLEEVADIVAVNIRPLLYDNDHRPD